MIRKFSHNLDSVDGRLHDAGADAGSRHNSDSAANSLRQEAMALMSSPKASTKPAEPMSSPRATGRPAESISSSRVARSERHAPPLNLDEEGHYKVMAGNSLSSIARRALLMRGESASWRSVNAEMDRIVAMNGDTFPGLTRDRQFIREGWKLKIWDKELGPDATCRWQPWVEAPPNQWTIVNKCQRALGLDGSWLVVQPGGEAVLNRGSKAFLAPNGSIKMALPGSMITAIGGEIRDFGATIHQQNSHVKIFKENTDL